MKRRTIEWLLWSYPASWRDRYGGELTALLEDAPSAPGTAIDVVRGGLAQRLRGAGLVGDDVPAEERARAGVLLVLCGWAAFTVAGCAFAKFAEHWQNVTPDSARTVPAAAFNVLLLSAELGSVAVLLGIAAGATALAAFLRQGGWATLRAPILRAAAVSAVAIGLGGIVIYWAHDLNQAQRNGGDWAYSGFGLVCVLLVVGSIALWTAAAVIAARRITLTPARLRFESWLACVATAAMLVMTAADLVWWISLASNREASTDVPFASPQLFVITLTMLAATAAAAAGSARSLRATR